MNEKPMDLMVSQYYLKARWERFYTEVTKEQFVQAERDAGYYNRRLIDEPCTGGFVSKSGISGRIIAISSRSKKRSTLPVLEISCMAGEDPVIIGVWGIVDLDTLQEIQDRLSNDVLNRDNGNETPENFMAHILIRITGYVEPEMEGPYVSAPGWWDWDEISREDMTPTEKELAESSLNDDNSFDIF